MKNTNTFIKLVIWVIVTMSICDLCFMGISAPDTLAVYVGFGGILAWIWISTRTKFFTLIHFNWIKLRKKKDQSNNQSTNN